MRYCFAIGAVLLLVGRTPAQGTKADYDRAKIIRQKFSSGMYKASIRPNWYPDNKRFWYSNALSGGKKEFVIVDAEAGTRTVVAEKDLGADAPKEAAPNTQRDRQRGRVGFFGDRPNWPNPSPHSPDHKWETFIKDNNVWLRDASTKDETRISKDGVPDDSYDGRVYWSPDSKKFAAIRTKKGGNRKVTLVESSPSDQLQPKLVEYPYLKPGDPIPQSIPHLFDVKKTQEIIVTDSLFRNPYATSNFHWSHDSQNFFFLYNQRGHQVMRLIKISAADGEATAVINEECKTFFDYSQKQYLRRLANGNYIWMSERSGWNHLYLIDAKTNEARPITKGEWVVRGVDRVMEEAGEIYIRVLGFDPKQSPYNTHFARVKIDGSGMTMLTADDGNHSIAYSPDRKYFVDTYSRPDLPPINQLRKTADGSKVCDLEKADISELLKKGMRMPERFVAKGRDGKTDIWGLIHRPTNFDANKKYRVIESIYAGPHDHFVPKTFSPVHYESPMAELGFILVKIDGMGTNWRSKAFHDYCWQNIGDSGFPDRLKWIKEAAAKYSQMDISKGVGIYGGSAGGQSAMRGMTEYPDFYVAGVADCGCHDNRMDKIWWNEAWMGWPIGPHYAAQSNVTNAHKITGKLMLVVGEKDTNVDPASTMQVVNALIKADKDFDLLVVPGGGHGIAESPYGNRRRMDFFVRNLLHVEPRR